MGLFTKHEKNAEPDEREKSARKLLGELIPALSNVLEADLEADRVIGYVNALADLSELQVKHAINRATKFWTPSFGRRFPSPAELREYANEIDGDPKPQKEIPIENIDAGKVPKGWSVEEWKRAQLTLRTVRMEARKPLPPDLNEPANETKTQYAQRLIAQMRAAIAAGCNSFPDENAQHDRLADAMARERLGGSEKPADREEKYRWARQKAEDMGWKS